MKYTKNPNCSFIDFISGFDVYYITCALWSMTDKNTSLKRQEKKSRTTYCKDNREVKKVKDRLPLRTCGG